MKDAINEDGKWKIIKSEYLFRRPWLTVRRDCVELPDGRQNPEFYVMEYPDWVNVIALGYHKTICRTVSWQRA